MTKYIFKRTLLGSLKNNKLYYLYLGNSLMFSFGLLLMTTMQLEENTPVIEHNFTMMGIVMFFSFSISSFCYLNLIMLSKTSWFTSLGYEHIYYQKFNVKYKDVYTGLLLSNVILVIAPYILIMIMLFVQKLQGEFGGSFVQVISVILFNVCFLIVMVARTLYLDIIKNNLNEKNFFWIGHIRNSILNGPFLLVFGIILTVPPMFLVNNGDLNINLTKFASDNIYRTLSLSFMLLTILYVFYIVNKVKKISTIRYREVKYE